MSNETETEINEAEVMELEEAESKVMSLLLKEPSSPIEIEGEDFHVVFQRPKFRDKHKGRVWANKQLRAMGYNNPDEEDRDLTWFFHEWGALNTHVTSIFVKDEDEGVKRLNGELVTEYPYDASADLDYKHLFEKFVIEEYYDEGRDEIVVLKVISAFREWLKEGLVSRDEVKNS